MLTVLTECPMFQGVPLDGLTALAERGQKRTFPRGAQIARQGEISQSLHIVLKGHVCVERSHPSIVEPIILAELGPGEVVGLEVLNGQPRSATVRAVEETETLRLEAAVLVEALAEFPEVSLALLRALSRRLQASD